MIGNVWVLLDDKKSVFYTKTFYKEDKELFKKLNSEGWGVYKSVNDFEATQEEMDKLKVKTKRNIPFLTKINGVFADLDIAKAGDGQTITDKSYKKAMLFSEIANICEPSIVIETSNGLQPIWRLKDTNTSIEYQKRYVNVINGIIEWSKTVGGAGDKVKDVTRILRVPQYYHMKEEPFECIEFMNNYNVFSLEELEKIFLKYIPIEEKKEVKQDPKKENLSDKYKQVENLDFQEVIIKAFQSINRTCEFDKQGRIILDGRLTGNFQGKHGDKEYLASTSHEAFEGNKVTAVADILQVSNKEAYKWILETFKIESQKITIPKKEYSKNRRGYLYGNEHFEEFDCAMDGELVVIVAQSNSGKTTFAMDMLQTNIDKGKKCFYINLEFAIETVWMNRWLFLNGKKKRNLTDIEPLTESQKNSMDYYVNMNLKKFDYYNNPRGIKIEEVVNLIIEKEKSGYGLFVIDSFSKIIGNLDSKISHTRQNQSMEILQELCQNLGIVIVILHHTNKKGEFEGSQKIMDFSNVFIIIVREDDGFGNSVTKFELTKDKFVNKKNLELYYVDQKYTKQEPEKEQKPF